MWRRLARWAVPGPIHAWGRTRLHHHRQRRAARLPAVDEGQFRRLLADDLGLAPGQVVFVHASLGGLRLAFPFYRVLTLLREAVGPAGTLLFPSTQLRERPETWLARDEAFDVRLHPTSMGAIAELARRQRGACRSLHPTHAVAALGPLAGDLTRAHGTSPWPCGPGSPFAALAEVGGRIIGLGVDPSVLTFVHCVEDLWPAGFPVATRREQLYGGRVVAADGCERRVETLVAHPRIRWRNIPAYARHHLPAAVCQAHHRHGAPFYAAAAAPLLAAMADLATRRVTIYTRLIHRGCPTEPLLSWLAGRLG